MLEAYALESELHGHILRLCLSAVSEASVWRTEDRPITAH